MLLLIQHRHPAVAERQLADVLHAFEVALGVAPAARIFGSADNLASGVEQALACVAGPLKDLELRRYSGAATIAITTRRLGQLNKAIAGLQAAMTAQRAFVSDPVRITPMPDQATG